jgi:ferredoxin
MDYDRIERQAAEAGLAARGGFHPEPDDGVPGSLSAPTATLVLLGAVGPSLWPVFVRAPEHADGRPHPLDRWTRRVAGGLAATLNAGLVLPSDGPPYHPFQRWARRAEPVHGSPLGILIHPRYGLWHAYRAALLFAERIALPETRALASPCDSCAGRPCLSACPVGAFTNAGYAVDACVDHLARPAGHECLDGGCRARLACPIGTDYRYGADQMRFHMATFFTARAGQNAAR